MTVMRTPQRELAELKCKSSYYCGPWPWKGQGKLRTRVMVCCQVQIAIARPKQHKANIDKAGLASETVSLLRSTLSSRVI